MHIAVCFDNIADRKQLERLLGRESDKRKADDGVFYIDSYGQSEKLFPKRMSYDILFIDIQSEDVDSLKYAVSMCDGGVTAPIILCSEGNIYRDKASEIENCPKNILFLNKPILKAELSDILDEAQKIKSLRKRTIEIRHQTNTYYVYEDDIEYIKANGRYVEVYLSDGNHVPVLDSVLNFYRNLYDFEHFALISPKLIVNGTYVIKMSPFRIKLNCGFASRISFSGFGNLKTTMINIEKEKRNNNDNQ